MIDKWSDETVSCADGLVRCYSTPDGISLENISDHDMSRLAALMMLDDSVRAAEATGPDNPVFCSRMLPALVRLMRSDTETAREDFSTAWRDGVVHYYTDAISELLELRAAVHYRFCGE